MFVPLDVVVPENREAALLRDRVCRTRCLYLAMVFVKIVLPATEGTTGPVDGEEVAHVAIENECLEGSKVVKEPAPAHDTVELSVRQLRRTQRGRLREGVGELMYQTHEGLSKDYEVSCEELDFLNQVAKDNGVTGSRIMGGGFGGCTINLVRNDLYRQFIADAKKRFNEKYGHEPKVYDVVIGDGSRKLC